MPRPQTPAPPADSLAALRAQAEAMPSFAARQAGQAKLRDLRAEQERLSGIVRDRADPLTGEPMEDDRPVFDPISGQLQPRDGELPVNRSARLAAERLDGQAVALLEGREPEPDNLATERQAAFTAAAQRLRVVERAIVLQSERCRQLDRVFQVDLASIVGPAHRQALQWLAATIDVCLDALGGEAVLISLFHGYDLTPGGGIMRPGLPTAFAEQLTNAAASVAEALR